MRTIPAELLNRLKKKWQGTAENANPGMKAYLSRGLINELFKVYTIQEGENVEAVDVTVSRPETEADPSEVYAICLDSGVASVKSKPLPYDELVPWISEFQVSSGVADTAIEFNGYWKYNFDENRFNFITEEYPWIFYIVSGTLKAQYWQDEPITLSTDVSVIAAIRGWVPANGETSNDQGLIVAYIKTDGHVYYRNYCIQEDEQVLWESEKQITAFTGTVSNLSLFRTNDFRIGFIAEISGELYWVVTERNYAGMSVPPDTFVPGLSGMTGTFDFKRITYHEVYSPDDTFIGTQKNYCMMNMGYGGTTVLDTAVTVTSAMRTGDYTFYIEFSHDISPLDGSWIIGGGIEMLYTVASYSINGDRLNIVTNEVTEFVGFACTLHESVIYGFVAEGVRKLVPQTVVSVQGAVPDTNETFPVISFTGGNFDFKRITKTLYENGSEETFEPGITLSSLTMSCVRINSLPI
jgi:hypothetical protein